MEEEEEEEEEEDSYVDHHVLHKGRQKERKQSEGGKEKEGYLSFIIYQ